MGFAAGPLRAAAVILLLLSSPALAQSGVAAMTDVEFDAWFRCPESFATDPERAAAVAAYYRWAKARHPEWTLEDIVKARITLLLRHRCGKTLQTLPPALINPP